MRKRRKKRIVKQENDSLLKEFTIVLKGSVVAVIITLISIIISAFIWQYADLHDSVMKPVMQGIRILSIAIGGAFSARLSMTKGWLKGAAAGLLYVFFASIISIMSGASVSFNMILLSDIITAAVVGAIGGAIGINLG